ncbi:universal stress protein [Glaciibacter psychrotolerans]|uniref:Nucleotide-binding universal stress UspA family protein n=1 Tax=Glaciibacter psychrotolerans TaxID=670054 RepID=A0A7Z0EBV5_9MICO|nr:universal stress protein [Leifsonia psychrotolerans]NYJ18658.1 nucleotide-binding universal stress UspA family protein [Leifsonia psychrotolerans]
MTKTIVIGIDGTEAGRAALRWALARAEVGNQAVVLLHVVDDEWGMIGTRLADELNQAARDMLDRSVAYARSLAPDLDVVGRLVRGSPVWELIEVSGDGGLTVVGTHKTGYIHGKVFGSRSLQLAAGARSPVAIIPQGWLADAHGVVVGVDGSAAGRVALRFAAAEARRTRQTLTLIRTWNAPKLPETLQELEQERDATLERDAGRLLEEAAQMAKHEHADLEVRTRVVHRPAAEALVDASSAAALLVVGRSRRPGTQQFILGSVAHDVLLNLAVPTIVVHPDDID